MREGGEGEFYGIMEIIKSQSSIHPPLPAAFTALPLICCSRAHQIADWAVSLEVICHYPTMPVAARCQPLSYGLGFVEPQQPWGRPITAATAINGSCCPTPKQAFPQWLQVRVYAIRNIRTTLFWHTPGSRLCYAMDPLSNQSIHGSCSCSRS